MGYAIISVGSKQYRVREGERLLVDRVALDDGATFTPPVLLVGGDGGVAIAPDEVTVTVRVVGQQRGPKIRIGKYKKRTGYKRHTGFRSALTQIEVESIGGGKTRTAARPKTEVVAPGPVEADVPAGVPEGYAELTVAQVREASRSWEAEAVSAALAYEQAHANRKGAVAALETALGKGN